MTLYIQKKSTSLTIFLIWSDTDLVALMSSVLPGWTCAGSRQVLSFVATCWKYCSCPQALLDPLIMSFRALTALYKNVLKTQ